MLKLFQERLVCAIIGAIFGALYGAIIGLIVSYYGGTAWNIDYVKSTAIVFAVLGLLVGQFIGDVIAAVLHFLFGAATVEAGQVPDSRFGLVGSLFWLGFGTFIAVLLVVRPW